MASGSIRMTLGIGDAVGLFFFASASTACLVAADCDDASQCTSDACVGGLCQYTNRSTAVTCDDG